jgi:hypothetical protein
MQPNTANHTQRPKGPLTVLRERTHDILGDLRQWKYPPEFRIARPCPVVQPTDTPKLAQTTIPASESTDNMEQAARMDRTIAKVAVCLWDIRRKLESSEAAQQDRKLRLLNRRAEAAVSALQEVGVVIDDPIGRRYAPGSEGSMKPNFQPTHGTTCEQVVETIAPIVYRDERLIGRGEVFVAVPAPESQVAATEARAVDAPKPTGQNDTADAEIEPVVLAPTGTTAENPAADILNAPVATGDMSLEHSSVVGIFTAPPAPPDTQPDGDSPTNELPAVEPTAVLNQTS